MTTRTQTWRDRAALLALIPVAIVRLAWSVVRDGIKKRRATP